MGEGVYRGVETQGNKGSCVGNNIVIEGETGEVIEFLRMSRRRDIRHRGYGGGGTRLVRGILQDSIYAVWLTREAKYREVTTTRS